MSRRKTKQQKIIADLRKKMQTEIPTVSHKETYSLPKTTQTTVTERPLTTITAIYDHRHVMGDIRKTMLVTLTILVAEIMLYFLLMKHIVNIPMLQF